MEHAIIENLCRREKSARGSIFSKNKLLKKTAQKLLILPMNAAVIIAVAETQTDLFT